MIFIGYSAPWFTSRMASSLLNAARYDKNSIAQFNFICNGGQFIIYGDRAIAMKAAQLCCDAFGGVTRIIAEEFP